MDRVDFFGSNDNPERFLLVVVSSSNVYSSDQAGTRSLKAIEIVSLDIGYDEDIGSPRIISETKQ